MELAFDDKADVRIVSVKADRIDAVCAIDFKDRMHELTTDAPSRIVLDLSDVDFIDSSGLGAIVASLKLAGPSRSLELANLSANVIKVFQLTRMDTVFAIHKDVEAAISDDLANAS